MTLQRLIYGNGQIGRTFLTPDSVIPPHWLVIACGVSNSSAPFGSEHLRERETIKQIMVEHPDHRLLYFSTYGVLDPALKEQDYFQHKIEMEKLILGTGRGRIVRLPNVIGPVHTPNTMIGYFTDCLLNQEPLPTPFLTA